jgi:hypothetical protein
MKMTIALMFLTFILFGFGTVDASAQRATGNVVVNATRLSEEFLSAFEKRYGVRIPDGNYWYDARAGVWGMEGGPALGFTLAGLNLGGPLRADASRGNTKVFINGRELHIYDVLSLQQLVNPYSVMPGRYWVDAYGNFGYEGGPALGNLVQIARARAGSGGYKGGYDSGIGSVMSDGQGCVGFISGSSSAISSKC